MTIEVDHQGFTTAVADVRAAADTFDAARRRISHEVDALLDAGWTGVAAGAFAEGWADWQRAAGDVLDGLVTMGRLLDAVHADLTTCDTDVRAALDRVGQRILVRLG